jgi:hypothetical protein
MTMIVNEEIEYYYLGGIFVRQQPNPRFCRMQPQLQRVKGFIGDDQLAVEDEPLDRKVARRFDDLREVSAKWALSP